MLVLGVDLGTSGAKALLLDVETGRVTGRGYAAYPSAIPAEGAHEQSPDDWWAATVTAIRRAVEHVDVREIRAVGLSGHMHALVLVDPQGKCVRPALTWADRRCADQVSRLRSSQEEFSAKCANPVVEAFTAPKLAWVAENEPHSLERAVRLVQPKDFLRHRLTGTWGTDTTDARGTLLYDLRHDRWDESLWALCGVSMALAPEASGSADVIGEVSRAAAAEMGIVPGTPVVAGAGDVASSALGAGVVRAGTVYVNAGTAAQVLAPLEEPVVGSHFVFGRAASSAYLAMASVYAAGMSVDWAARSLLGEEVTAAVSAGAALDDMAAAAGAGASGAVFVPHLLGTSVPSHDARVRGAFLGLSADQRPPTLARAVLEGVAFACADAVAHVSAVVGGTHQVLVGGGLSESRVWCQTLAAVLDVPVARVPRDTSPMGAAMLAGIGVGAWADAGEAADRCVEKVLLQPPERGVMLRCRSARHRYKAAVDAVTAFSRLQAEQDPAGQEVSA